MAMISNFITITYQIHLHNCNIFGFNFSNVLELRQWKVILLSSDQSAQGVFRSLSEKVEWFQRILMILYNSIIL